MPPKKAAKRQAKASPKKRATVETTEEVVVEQPTKYVDLTVANVPSDPVAAANSLMNDRRYYWLVAGLLALFQIVLGIVIILKVPYTKIDWDAYMQQVDMFLSGERDYSKIEGETGPLVYPAGHLYIYTAFHKLLPAHGRERPAQFIFLAVETITFLLSAQIYYLAGRTKHVPQWTLIPLVLSKRSHSIYLLRLFNDPLAMVLLYSAVVIFQYNWWKVGCFVYSLALGVKMNILLFFPGLLVLLFQHTGFFETFKACVIIVFVQLGLPSMHFLDDVPNIIAYFTSAFDFSRQFLYKWTVNWHMIGEERFLSQTFAKALLVAHVITLIAFGWCRWNPVPGGTLAVLKRGLYPLRNMFKPAVLPGPGQLTSHHVPLVLFCSNLIGVAFARSLHYQFHAWYFHQLPFLLYFGGSWGQLPVFVGLLAVLEKAWDTYPATNKSSLMLNTAHVAMLAGLWYMNAPGRQQKQTQQQMAQQKKIK